MMNELSKINNGELVSLVHPDFEIDLPQPFERDIFLFESHVAGTSYIDEILDLNDKINFETELNFFREIDNPYDNKAIMIKLKTGEKIGYVPKADNVVFSRLMDTGKNLFGKVEDKELVGNWLKIYIKIYLKE